MICVKQNWQQALNLTSANKQPTPTRLGPVMVVGYV